MGSITITLVCQIVNLEPHLSLYCGIFLAGFAVQQAALVLAVAHADGEVAVVAYAEVGAVLVLAAEEGQVVHGRLPGWKSDQACRAPAAVVENGLEAFNTGRTPPKMRSRGKFAPLVECH